MLIDEDAFDGYEALPSSFTFFGIGYIMSKNPENVAYLMEKRFILGWI